MHHAPLAVVLLALWSGSARAQSARVLPAGGYDHVWAGNNGSGTGYATQNGISQNLYIAPFAVGTAVQSVGFRRAASTADYPSVTIDFEITLSSTTADLTTLSIGFASNLGADATIVLPRQIVNIPARPASSSPHDWVGFATTPWVFQGPNFLVQCKSYGSGGINGWRMDRCLARPSAGEAITWGSACAPAAISSAGGSPPYMPGSTVTLTLANAAPSQPAVAVVGFDLARLRGVVPLPVDLTAIGMTGCTLLVDTAVTLASATDAGGAASLAIPIPAVGVSALGFGMQWVYADPAASNPSRLLSTAGRLVHVGPLPCANRYVYDLANVNATTGIVQAGGPIVRVTTVP